MSGIIKSSDTEGEDLASW